MAESPPTGPERDAPSLHARLRQIPSIDELLRSERFQAWVSDYGRDPVTDALRSALAECRQRLMTSHDASFDQELIETLAHRQLEALVEPTLNPVINATGVIIHTNLGRAPLSAETLAAMHAVGKAYSNLEFDLPSGRRGSRYVHAEDLLCRLTGAEAALLVNNNAGAVLLVLSTLAHGREVIVSRGQLIEIGGGFRIPDVMAQSGASLVEVGTTNRTYVRDYEAALTESTAALMRAHTSNYRIVGFSASPTLDELAALARARDLHLIEDLGSGTLLDTGPYGLIHEPTVQETVAGGADVVTFSGDKLLGGPQAGIIVGRAPLIERMRRHPLTRALRVDKTTIAGIQANLLHYVKREATDKVPVWVMLTMDATEIQRRARALLRRLSGLGAGCDLIPGRSMIGGGSLPEESLPTSLIALPASGADEMARVLRMGKPSVVGRIVEGRVVLDLRTVLPAQEDLLIGRLAETLGKGQAVAR